MHGKTGTNEGKHIRLHIFALCKKNSVLTVLSTDDSCISDLYHFQSNKPISNATDSFLLYPHRA